jgi:hypothetical protein
MRNSSIPKKLVGHFKDLRGNKVQIIRKDGESPEDAVKRVTSAHGRIPQDVSSY